MEPVKLQKMFIIRSSPHICVLNHMVLIIAELFPSSSFRNCLLKGRNSTYPKAERASLAFPAVFYKLVMICFAVFCLHHPIGLGNMEKIQISYFFFTKLFLLELVLLIYTQLNV